MAINDIVRIPKLSPGEHKKKWFKLEGGTVFENNGMIAEVGYSNVLDTEPQTMEGEPLNPGEKTEPSRGYAYVIQDAYYSYRFTVVSE